MDRRRFLKSIGLGTAGIALSGCVNKWRQLAGGGSVKKPNLLFVFPDQMRKQAMGFMNADPVITPNLDRFAAESRVFTNAISSCPLCTPFRAMVLTGRYPFSTGMVNNCIPGLDSELSEDEICISDVLKADGYQTGYIGKWHLDSPSRNKSKNPVDGATDWDAWTPPGPRRHGFDFWYAHGHYNEHFNMHYWADSPKKIEVKNKWSVEHETDVAIDFIRKRQKDKPFVLFVSWNPPHAPHIAPEKYKALYKNKNLPVRPNVKIIEEKFDGENYSWWANPEVKSPDQKYPKTSLSYYAAVSSCDDNFGRLLRTLDEEGIADDTIVVFTSDHGSMLGSHGRYGKIIWYEESIGIPFLVRWPGHVKPGTDEMLFASYDFMPTLLGLMGQPIPSTVETADYSDALRGKNVCGPSSAFIANYKISGDLLAVGQEPLGWLKHNFELREKGVDLRKLGYRGVRTKRYTYVVNRRTYGKKTQRLLYDNEKDRYQLNPVEVTSPEENPVAAELSEELQRWLDKTHDPFPV